MAHTHICPDCPKDKNVWGCTAKLCGDDPSPTLRCWDCSGAYWRKVAEEYKKQGSLFNG